LLRSAWFGAFPRENVAQLCINDHVTTTPNEARGFIIIDTLGEGFSDSDQSENEYGAQATN